MQKYIQILKLSIFWFKLKSYLLNLSSRYDFCWKKRDLTEKIKINVFFCFEMSFFTEIQGLVWKEFLKHRCCLKLHWLSGGSIHFYCTTFSIGEQRQTSWPIKENKISEWIYFVSFKNQHFNSNFEYLSQFASNLKNLWQIWTAHKKFFLIVPFFSFLAVVKVE